jgi:hypothetical protein
LFHSAVKQLAYYALFLSLLSASAATNDAGNLRLIPFPKEIQLQEGRFNLQQALVLETAPNQIQVIAKLLNAELRRAGLPAVQTRETSEKSPMFRLAAQGKVIIPTMQVQAQNEEAYALEIGPEALVCYATQPAGLVHGVQTLCQLIRANREGTTLACMKIRDWPSLRWRCFQDDMTRGPSSMLDTLKFEAGLGSYFKFNLMTFYMEYQYAFKKHPKIGPTNGSLTPEDLAALVKFVQPLGLDILGNQQSFGHFSQILKHPEYIALREGPDLLTPVKEQTYQLLDDMYSEVCPLVPFPWFNVCCDETWGLGTGPSKELAGKIGVGGVYVQHIRRVHDLLQQKYKKRMMMWGDIILQHPDNLKDIPKDTIMLTWGYDARPSFEDQIIPFAKSGYEFFVCPGVSDWSRILPDFAVANTNIHNFVRDGVKHGAIGMLNTDWEDDGEALKAVKWYADAWAAECAWNASATSDLDFNRRVGAVLFGEKGTHFAQAVELLAKTHRLSGMQGMNNSRFWKNDFSPQGSLDSISKSASNLLALVQPAIENLLACKKEAIVNQPILDVFMLGARRMEHIGQRMMAGLKAAQLYEQAYDLAGSGEVEKAKPLLKEVFSIISQTRDAEAALGKEFSRVWLSESKPYALDWTMNRYDIAAKRYDKLLQRLADAPAALGAGKGMPKPDDVGLVTPNLLGRRSRPSEIVASPLAADAPWIDTTASHRIGLKVRAGAVDRLEFPVEMDLTLPEAVINKPVRTFQLLSNGTTQEVLAQVDPAGVSGKTTLVVVLPSLSKNSEASIHVYLGLPAASARLPQAASTTKYADGMKWLENDKLRLLLGSEGGHIYRWELKAANNRDLTMPGDTGWAGFCDSAAHRNEPYRVEWLAGGPALVRFQCIAPSGDTKIISLFGGASWIEVTLNEPTDLFWNFDTPKNFAADGPTPGTYLFSNGKTGPVGRQADGVPAQVKAKSVQWGIKYNQDKLALGLATPENPAYHHIAPGDSAGGVGIESSTPASHFVIFGGLIQTTPAETMQRLCQALDLKNQPEIVLFKIQERNN